MDVASLVASNIIASPEDHTNIVIHEALSEEEDAIRLIRLEPSELAEDEIRCHLRPIKVNGDSLTLQSSIEVSYGLDHEASSYTWDGPLPTQRIVFNRQEVFVRSNLHDCLKRLQKRDCHLQRP